MAYRKLNEMTESERKDYFYRKKYHRDRPERISSDEMLDWSQVEHKDFFETMTYLEIVYDSNEWNLLEHGDITIVEETDLAIKLQAKRDGKSKLRGEPPRHDQWIPKSFFKIDKDT